MAYTGQDLIDQVRAELDEPSASSNQWTDTNLLAWVNKGLTRVMLKVREQRSHWFDKVMLSTDAASTIKGESYNPTVSLVCTADATTITLPPDCIEVVSILPTDQDLLDRGVSFSYVPFTSPEYNVAQRAN